MSPITDFIQSGILELYVMGAATQEEILEVERMAANHPEVKEEILIVQQGIENFAVAHAVEPKSTVKPLIVATIDYLERLNKGEEAVVPPELTSASRPEHFAQWLEREDFLSPLDDEDIFVKLIGVTPAATTAVVWLKDVAEDEIHHDEHERFLILEGTCEITVEGTVNHLNPGAFFAIPLHQKHMVKVTSSVPCKVILQRLAA